jgi:hypothetical protein
MEAYYSNGKDIQKALEAAVTFWQKPTLQIFTDDYRNLESLLNSLMLYDGQYKNDLETIVGVPENKLLTTIPLTDEEKEYFGDISVDFVVVLDLLLEVNDMKWVIDFKTTSVDLPYIASRLRKMVQIMGYQFVGQRYFKDVTGAMIYYHQLKASKSRKTGLYGDIKTDFMKFPMIFSEKDYTDWRRYVIWNAFKQHYVEKADYPPNYNSCYEFNKSCSYLPLCDYPTWNPDKFIERDDFVVVPDERKEITDDAE